MGDVIIRGSPQVMMAINHGTSPEIRERSLRCCGKGGCNYACGGFGELASAESIHGAPL
jgi:hypothetical protein